MDSKQRKDRASEMGWNHVRAQIAAARDDFSDVIAAMPNRATNGQQRSLQRKHGTPRAFARAVVNAIGEISVLEAGIAIRKYRDEWEAANAERSNAEP